MAPVNILLLNVYFHREKEIITFSLGRNIIRLYFHSLETECSFWNFLFITYHTLYFKDDSFCFSVHTCGVMKSLYWQFYWCTTWSLQLYHFQKSKPPFIGQQPVIEPQQPQIRKLQDACKYHFYIFTFWMPDIHQSHLKRKKKSHGLISLSVYLFCIYNIENIFLICHVLLHHWLFLWP